MVLRACERVSREEGGCDFTLRRAGAEADALPACAERSILKRALLVLSTENGSGSERIVPVLLQYACELETTRRLPEAGAVLALARSFATAAPEIALHAGRIARKLGDRGRALEMYRTARDLDGDGGAIARLAAIGEAAVSDDAEMALGRVIRGAVRVGDAEAAAVGLEERARVRCAAGRRRAAARDLCVAAARFPDAADRARVAHQLADIMIAAGDPLAAREALLLALALGDAPQRDHARVRLHTLCRDLGDRVGMRRWRSFQRPALVSLSVYRVSAGSRTAAPVLRRWREWVEAAGTAVGCR